jgi:uncharacterized protein YqeY
MPSLVDRLNAELKDAMRAGDTVRRDEIRGLLAMLKAEQQTKLTRALASEGLILHGDNVELSADQQREIDRLRATTLLDAAEEQDILLQRVKQHRQSIDAFQQGKRADLATLEAAQLGVDETFLPDQMDAAAVEDAVSAAIEETGASSPRDVGKVMGLLSPRLRGRADMKAVAARVQARLGQN